MFFYLHGKNETSMGESKCGHDEALGSCLGCFYTETVPLGLISLVTMIKGSFYPHCVVSGMNGESVGCGSSHKINKVSITQEMEKRCRITHFFVNHGLLKSFLKKCAAFTNNCETRTFPVKLKRHGQRNKTRIMNALYFRFVLSWASPQLHIQFL